MILVTVCINEILLERSQDNDPLAALNDALLGCLNMLRSDDWVCFNVGNSSNYLKCDKQSNIISWKEMPEKFEFCNEVGEERRGTIRSLSLS